MSTPRAFGDVFVSLAASMREVKARWYVFGAQAAMLWGRPRITADIDVTVEIPTGRIDEFIETMRRHTFQLRFEDREFIVNTRVLPFVHAATGLPLDVVLAGPGLEEEFLSRAIEVDVEGTVVPVISPEDLVITKILAGRPKDIEDVRGVLQERAKGLDVDRIRATLAMLETALSQSDLVVVLETELARLP